jgi:excisionase family DNA binding protein
MLNTMIPPALQAAARLDAASGTYTVADLARLLQCSERHVWRQIDLGAIPGKILFGRLVRFSRAVVDAWLAGQH